MSKDAVADFLAAVGEDPAQQEALERAVEGAENSAMAIVAAAAQRGYEFTVEELVEVIAALHPHEQGELTDDELKSVAGGILLGPSAGVRAQGDKPEYTPTPWGALDWKRLAGGIKKL